MNQPESRFFSSFGLRLHYAAWADGTKPPLVLVHGKSDHARTWDPLAEVDEEIKRLEDTQRVLNTILDMFTPKDKMRPKDRPVVKEPPE